MSSQQAAREALKVALSTPHASECPGLPQFKGICNCHLSMVAVALAALDAEDAELVREVIAVNVSEGEKADLIEKLKTAPHDIIVSTPLACGHPAAEECECATWARVDALSALDGGHHPRCEHYVKPTKAWEFIEWIFEEGVWEGCDIDGGDLQEKAIDFGLVRLVPGGFDPEKHHDRHGDAGEGDDWYELVAEPAPSPPDADRIASLEARLAEAKARSEFADDLLRRVFIDISGRWDEGEKRDWCCDYKDYKNGAHPEWIKGAGHENCSHRLLPGGGIDGRHQ